jgi:hypothetical protein
MRQDFDAPGRPGAFSKHCPEFSMSCFVSETLEEEKGENNSLSDRVHLMP